MLGLLCAAAAAPGMEPQCPTSGIRPCLARIDARFADFFWPGSPAYDRHAGAPFAATGAPRDVMCSAASYKAANACGAGSDLRLTILEPAEFRGQMALQSFLPVPWVGGAHMDQRHPAHGKVMDVVGGNGWDPCGLQTWAGGARRLSGQILVARFSPSFPCSLVTPLYYAKLMLDLLQLPLPAAAITAMGSDEGLLPVGIPATGYGFDDVPMHMGPGALAYMVEEAESKGQTVRGKIELVCPTDNAPVPQEPGAAFFTDGCPDDRLRGLCDDMPAQEDRLCSKCPLQLKHNGSAVCVYGSRLSPARAAHFFQATRAVPSTAELMYVEPPPWGGCRAVDYAGVAGKVAVFSFRYCMLDAAGVLNAARLAEQQGATGVVFLSHRESYFMLSGPGLLHNVPIHTVSVKEGGVVVGWFAEANSSELTVELVDEGKAPDPVLPPAPTEAPVPFVVAADAASFKATPGAVVLIMVVVVLMGAIGGKLARDSCRAGGGGGGLSQAAGVPLSVASTLLSVSLLVVVAVIACALSARAAHDATEAAASDGASATALTYGEAQENAARMSSKVLALALGQVTGSLEKRLRGEEATVAGLQELMAFWDGSWRGFKERAAAFYGLTTFRENGVEGEVYMGVQTVEGFYFDSKWMTDFTTDRLDFANGHHIDDVLERQQSAKDDQGNFYSGLRATSFQGAALAGDPSTLGLQQQSSELWTGAEMTDSPLQRVGGELVDPVAEVRRLGLGPGEHAWRVASEGVPFRTGEFWRAPIVTVTVLAPLYDVTKQEFRGVLTSVIDVGNFHGLLASAAAQDVSLQNMTALVYDAQTEALIGSSNHASTNDIAAVVDLFHDGYAMSPHYKALPISQSTEVADSALANYLRAHTVNGTTAAEGEFDQRDYYSHPDLHELNVAVGAEGDLGDWSRHALPLEMRMGRCGRCVVPDAAYGRVVRFDGGNTLYVNLNLTTDVAYVASKRKGSGSDAWDSDDPMYKYTMPIPRTRQTCIYRNTSLHQQGWYQCSMRGAAAFPRRQRFTISIRVKPDAAVAAGDRVQRLFQHSAVGNSLVTVYASGELVVGTLMGECVVPGAGTPGGVWTTVTARLDGRVCEVFMNGTRVGGTHSSARNVEYYHNPFAIGNGFMGAIQNVRIHPFLHDPAVLNGGGAFVRHVPSKRWFFKTADGSFAPGLRWTVSVRIPRDDVLRDVDANNARLVANLRQQSANTQGQLDRDLVETVLAAAAVVLVSVLVFLVFNDLLTRPFAEVSSIMCDAAVLRIEEVPERRSLIAELNAMHAAMQLMLANLKEYKSYMPQHLMASVMSDDGSDGGSSADAGSMCSSLSLSKKSSESGSGSDSRSGSGSGSGSGSAGALRPHRVASGRISTGNMLALQLSKRRVSLAALNVVGFTELARAKEDKEIIAMHSALAVVIMNETAALRGIVDTFSGDRFFVTFNASKMLTSHRPAAGSLGCIFSSRVKEMGLTPSAGLASGEAKVGNLGCATMRNFSFVSSLVPFVHALERHAAGLGASALAGASIQRECQREILFRRAGLFRLQKFRDGALPIFEALKIAEATAADEWMYELEAAEKLNPYKEWDALVDAVVTGRWAAAHDLLHAADCDAPLAVALREAAARHEYEVPDYSKYY